MARLNDPSVDLSTAWKTRNVKHRWGGDVRGVDKSIYSMWAAKIGNAHIGFVATDGALLGGFV